MLGLFAPGPAPVNVACASIAAGAGGQSSLTVNVLKAGHVLGAPPRGQLRAQMLGAFAGVFVALAAYTFVRNAHGIGNATFPVPGALGWKAAGRARRKRNRHATGVGGRRVCVWRSRRRHLSLLEKTRVGRFVPSPVALAAAFLVPASTGAAIGLGALVWMGLKRHDPRPPRDSPRPWRREASREKSLMGFVIAALIAFGVLPNG